jgi:hypothetical protein
VASAYLLSEPTIFLGKYLYQVRNVLFFSCSVDWKLRWLPLYISETTTVRHYARSVGTLPNKGNNNGTVLQGAFKRESPQKQTKPIRSSTAKTKHKKLWKFYWNPFCCLGRVMDNATVSSLYCIALYDKVQTWRNFSKNC